MITLEELRSRLYPSRASAKTGILDFIGGSPTWLAATGRCGERWGPKRTEGVTGATGTATGTPGEHWIGGYDRTRAHENVLGLTRRPNNTPES